MFTACVSLVLDSKYVQFRIICSLLFSIIVDIFEVEPHSSCISLFVQMYSLLIDINLSVSVIN
mgnify:CR=1 FL=1